MKKLLYPFLFICLFAGETLIAQDSLLFREDSLHSRRNTNAKRSDTSRPRVRRNMPSLFSDSAQLTSSDYQLQIEKSYVLLNNIETKSELGFAFDRLKKTLTENDSIEAVLKVSLFNNGQALNIRNLQVFSALLENIREDTRRDRRLLDSTENQLENLRKDLKSLNKDTVLKQLQSDSLLRQQFVSELQLLREAGTSAMRRLRRSLAVVNRLQTRSSSNAVVANQLLAQADKLLEKSTARIFSKEDNYLWEKDTTRLLGASLVSYAEVYNAEKKALDYYFKDSGGRRFLLLLAGVLFFVWIYRNIRGLKKAHALANLKAADFQYLPAGYIVSPIVMMLCIAPLFDLKAPYAYIEGIGLLLVILLTIMHWKKWPRQLFMYWLALGVLFVLFSLSYHVANPGFWQRSFYLLLNLVSIAVGWLFLSKMKEHLELKGFLRFAISVHNLLNIISIICNLSGRVTLAQILGNAAIFGFLQAIGLAVFSKICMETFLLQVVASRVKRNAPNHFEFNKVVKDIGRPLLFLVVVLWLIVFTTNLYIYTAVRDAVFNFLSAPRMIGSAALTLRGVLLFFMIIWLAHLLQQYVGYFFGETEGEAGMQNKKARSRLLITRLVVLTLGYLLAVAASGVPVDKITIVLGALGVGIGLGLQNIVHNFVSGIILIFDRPLQIGDTVEIGAAAGKVREIGLRSSTILTPDGAEVIIPNGDLLSQQIVNWTLTNDHQRLEMDLSVSGDNDMEKVGSTVKAAVLAADNILEQREPQILFTKIKEDGFELKVFFWCADVGRSANARSEVLLLLHNKLSAAGMHLEAKYG